MKREGRQHGLVRTYPIILSPANPRPDSRVVNRFDSPPTSGLFTKVSTKPTNHSKFTGKCGKPRCATCHLHPASKSKDKTKGTHKLNSPHMVSDYKLITWRVVDARPGFNFSGFSASGILDHLGSDDDDDYMDDDDEEVDYEYDGAYDQHDWMEAEEERVEMGSSEVAHIIDSVDEHTDGDDQGKYQEEEDEDEDGVIEGEEGWCLVGEM